MKKTNKILGVFIFFMIALCLSNNVFGARINIEDIDIYNGEYEYYKMNEGILTNVGASSEDYNIRLEKENNELYLNNFNTTKSIYTDLEELNIILEGKNSITGDDFNAIDSNGNMTFSGSGSLEIVAEGNGIKSVKKVTINGGTITVDGTEYNGIEAFQIEINDGLVTASGGYSGIHARFDPEMSGESYFYMNGGNLFTEGNKGAPINSSYSEYKNCIVVHSKEGKSYFGAFGNAVLMKDVTVSAITIPQNSVLTIPEGVTLKLEDKEQLTLNGTILLSGRMFAGEKEYHEVYVNESENGIVKVSNVIVLEGEDVELTITPDSNYELESLKYVNNTTKEEVAIENNKFTMPNSDVSITSTFAEIKNEVVVPEDSTNNPPTGDNILLALGIFGITLIGVMTVKFRKN